MSEPWDPASEDPHSTRPTSPSGDPASGPNAKPGPSFEAPTWRPVDSGTGPAMPPSRSEWGRSGSGRSGSGANDGPDWQQTADLSQPTPVDVSQPGRAFPVVPPPARKRRVSPPLIIAIVVVGVLVLLLAADRVGAVVAGQRTAAQLQSSYDLSRTPKVGFHGFPFLTQLASSSFDEVDVSAEDLPVKQQSGEFVVNEVQATLHGVRPEADRIRISSLQGSALVGYQGVSAVVGRGVTYAGRDGSGGRVRIELTGAIAVTAGLTFDAASSKFQVLGVKLTAGGQSLPAGVVEPLVNQLMAPVSNLPDGLQPTRVDVTAEGVRLHGTGEDLVFDR